MARAVALAARGPPLLLLLLLLLLASSSSAAPRREKERTSAGDAALAHDAGDGGQPEHEPVGRVAVEGGRVDAGVRVDHLARGRSHRGWRRRDSNRRRRRRRSLLFSGEELSAAHKRARAETDAVPVDEVGVDDFEKEWSDPSWQAGGTGGAADFTHTGCNAAIVEWNRDASRPIFLDAPGNVTTAAGGCLGGFADGYASKSRFRHPADVAVAPDGTVLYVADVSNRRVRAVSLSDAGALGVRTIAGTSTAHVPMGGHRDGPGASALFRSPAGLALVKDPNRPAGNVLYVADSTDNRIRRVELSVAGMTSLGVSTLVGGGSETALEMERRARVGTPQHSGVVWPTPPPDPFTDGSRQRNGRRNKQSRRRRGDEPAEEGTGQSVVPPGVGSTDHGPRGVNPGFTPPGLGGHKDGAADVALLRRPRGLAATPDGRMLYVADSGNNVVREVVLVDDAPRGGPSSAASSWGTVLKPKKKNGGGGIGSVATLTGGPPPARPEHVDGAYLTARFHNPSGVVVSPDGRFLYVADTGNHRVRRVDLRYRTIMPDKKDAVVTVAGTGRPGSTDGAALTVARLHDPWGLAIHPDGDLLFIADASGGLIRTLTLDPNGSPGSGARHKVATLTGRGCRSAHQTVPASVRTPAGTPSGSGALDDGAPVDGPAHAACLSMPMGCALSPAGGALYVADSAADRIRRVAAMTPTEIRTAAAMVAPAPLAPGTPCHCVTVARIFVGSGAFAADGSGPVVARPASASGPHFYKTSAFTVVVELDRVNAEFPLNALKVVSGGRVLSAAMVAGGDSSRPRFSYLVEAEGRSAVRLRVSTMRRVSVEGKIESGWEGDPEAGIEVLPHPSLLHSPVGLARDYVMDPGFLGMFTSFVTFAAAAAGLAFMLIQAWRRFAAWKAKRRHAVMMGDVFGAVEDWRTGRLTVQMVNHKGL